MEFWSSMWNILVVVFGAFIFVASILAMLAVITDLFRDKTLSGWWKALWILFLVLVPLLTVLVYLIARGKGMAQRSTQEGEAAKKATDDYIRTVAASTPTSAIAQAKSLLDSGAITADEFEQLKQRALQG